MCYYNHIHMDLRVGDCVRFRCIFCNHTHEEAPEEQFGIVEKLYTYLDKQRYVGVLMRHQRAYDTLHFTNRNLKFGAESLDHYEQNHSNIKLTSREHLMYQEVPEEYILSVVRA